MSRGTVYNQIVSDDLIKEVNKKNICLLEDYLDYLVSVDRSQSTINAYRSDINIFYIWNYKFNDNKFFTDLTKREVSKFQKYAMTEWGWSSNRLSRVKSALSSMSNYIENILDDEHPDYRPIIRKIESPVKQEVREKTVIADWEVDEILEKLISIGKYQAACVFALAAFSGSRKSELLRFKKHYFDDSNIMKDAGLYKTPEKIKTKGRGSSGKLLYKYTLPEFKKYYDLWIAERERLGINDCEDLFINIKTKNVLDISTLDSYAKTISQIYGKPFYFHSLRHQLCSRLIRKGIPTDVIQEYFGWANVSMVTIYNDNEASDSFGRFFTPEGIVGKE